MKQLSSGPLLLNLVVSEVAAAWLCVPRSLLPQGPSPAGSAGLHYWKPFIASSSPLPPLWSEPFGLPFTAFLFGPCDVHGNLAPLPCEAVAAQPQTPLPRLPQCLPSPQSPASSLPSPPAPSAPSARNGSFPPSRPGSGHRLLSPAHD